MNAPTVLRLEAGEAAAVAAALAAYGHALRTAHRPVPGHLEVLRSRFAAIADNHRQSMAVPAAWADHGRVTTRQAARLCGTSTRTIERRIAEGVLPSHRVGGARRIRVADIIDYLEGTR